MTLDLASLGLTEADLEPIDPLPIAPQRYMPRSVFDPTSDAFLVNLPPWALRLEGVRKMVLAALEAAPLAISAANYKGIYNAGATYQIGESVTHSGSRWYAKTVNTGVAPVDGANWGLIVDVPAIGSHGGKVMGTDGLVTYWRTVAIDRYAYDARTALRALTPAVGDQAIVEGLGLFVHVVGSDEPDDDESCFATATGRWLLELVHWDVVNALSMPDNEARDEWDEGEVARTEAAIAVHHAASFSPAFLSSFDARVLFGTAHSSITSIAAITQVSFTGTLVGAAVGDTVVATPPDALVGRISVFARVSAANTVTVYLNNPSAATATLLAGTWNITVFKA
jgi:hypothetical protein